MAISDQQIRLDCLKAAVSIATQNKYPQDSIVGVARQFYAFVMETGAAPDPLAEFRRGNEDARQ